MNSKIAITAASSISALGHEKNAIWQQYLNKNTLITKQNIGNKKIWVAKISEKYKIDFENIIKSDSKYKNLDISVIYALFAAQNAVKQAGWKNVSFGINIGSSRGATHLFETHFEEFLQTGKTPTLASPTTTLGNISSWVAHCLQSKSIAISHSVTCSTGLHAVLNGIAWLQAGFSDKFLVGASEAPLTPFTIAQMEALKIYSKVENEFPNQSLNLNKTKNTLVLGEAAAMLCLEKGVKENALAYISGIGFATDVIEHNTSLSVNGICFQESMKMALQNTDSQNIDAIVMHAPGTIKGDASELKAIESIFGKNIPLLTSNKWKIGHTFATSGVLSIEMAILTIQNNTFIGVPFLNQTQKKEIKNVLINAVGFGGNAVSILISKD